MSQGSTPMGQSLAEMEERLGRRLELFERRIVFRLGLLMVIGFGTLLILICTGG